MDEKVGRAIPFLTGSRPDLKSSIREASQALALLDSARLEELAVSCRALNGQASLPEVKDTASDMAVLGRVLEATRANLEVMRRLSAMRAGRMEYSEEQARGWTAENVHGKH
jgi:hypothetical protein